MATTRHHARTRLVATALAGMLALAAAGCADAGETGAATEDEGGPPEAGFPVTIENCGQTLTFDEPPTRVVAYTSGLDALIELGVEDSVIGMTQDREYVGHEQRLLPGHAAIRAEIDQVSDGPPLPDKEALLALQPDLAIASFYSSFDPSSGKATREELAAAGIPSFIMGNSCTPDDVKAYELQDTFDDVRDFGTIFGVPDRAEQLINELQVRVDEIERRVAGRDTQRVLFLELIQDTFYCYGSGIYDVLVELVGGENVFDGGAEGYAVCSAEEIAAADPDAIVIVQSPDGEADEPRIARVAEAAQSSPAVQEERYALVEGEEIWTGIRIVNGLERIAQAVHPDAFT